MSLVQTVNLEQIVDDTVSPNIISTWVAAHNPVYLEWIRKDKIVSSITNYELTPGVYRTELVVASNSGYTIGDSLYINLFDGAFKSEVVTIVALNGSTGIVISKWYGTPIPTPSGYVNNLTTRKNYYTEIELTDNVGTTQLALLQATPDTTGKVGIDISGALQSYLSNNDGAPLTSYSYYNDLDAYVGFKYRTKEFWTGSSEAYSSLSDLHYGINGEFQNLHQYNGNYAEYYTRDGSFSPKWLLDFSVAPVFIGYPTVNHYSGYPLDISALLTNDIDTTPSGDIYVAIEARDSDLNSLGSTTFTIPDTQLGSLIRVNPYQYIDPDQKFLFVFLQTDIGPIIEPIIIKLIDSNEICGGVYLEWLGEKGNRSYFLFNNKYAESLQVDGGGTYQKAFDSIDDLTERANWYEKKPFKKLTIGADNLERYEIEGLKSLLKSTKVYEVQQDGTKQGVLLEPGTFTIGRGDDNKFKIEFTIVFPEQFNQTA